MHLNALDHYPLPHWIHCRFSEGSLSIIHWPLSQMDTLSHWIIIAHGSLSHYCIWALRNERWQGKDTGKDTSEYLKALQESPNYPRSQNPGLSGMSKGFFHLDFVKVYKKTLNLYKTKMCHFDEIVSFRIMILAIASIMIQMVSIIALDHYPLPPLGYRNLALY